MCLGDTRRMSTVNSRTFDFLKMRRAALLSRVLLAFLSAAGGPLTLMTLYILRLSTLPPPALSSVGVRSGRTPQRQT
jgi:hypothetical protein